MTVPRLEREENISITQETNAVILTTKKSVVETEAFVNLDEAKNKKFFEVIKESGFSTGLIGLGVAAVVVGANALIRVGVDMPPSMITNSVLIQNIGED